MAFKTKIIRSLFLVVCCIFFVQVTSVEAATINKKKVTIYIGESVQLKLNKAKGKIKWSSTNAKIAKVSKKGKVIAKKNGKVTITAKNGKKKYTCVVKVKKYSIEKLKGKINKYFKKNRKYETFFVADDFDGVDIGNNQYQYYIRSTGGTMANVLVGSLTVNHITGEAKLSYDYGAYDFFELY